MSTKSKTTNKRTKPSSVLTQEEAVEAREAFDLFDPERSGSVALNDLPAALQAVGLDASSETIRSMTVES